METHEWFKFSKSNAKGIIIYYMILFVIGLSLAILAILHEKLLPCFSITSKSIIGGTGFALIGSTMFYSKKIYKSCIGNTFIEPSNTTDKIRQFGIILYFTLRPLFSIAFSLLIIIFLKMSCKIVIPEEQIITSGFIIITCFFSFFCGFSSGDLLDLLEEKGRNVFNNIMPK